MFSEGPLFWGRLYILTPYRLYTTRNATCKLWIFPACCKLSTSCTKAVDFIMLQQICENQIFATWYLQTCCKLLKQLASSLWIKKSWQSTCIKPVDNLQQTSYHDHQVGASDASASWYRLDASKVTSLQETRCDLRVSGGVSYRPLW